MRKQTVQELKSTLKSYLDTLTHDISNYELWEISRRLEELWLNKKGIFNIIDKQTDKNTYQLYQLNKNIEKSNHYLDESDHVIINEDCKTHIILSKCNTFKAYRPLKYNNIHRLDIIFSLKRIESQNQINRERFVEINYYNRNSHKFISCQYPFASVRSSTKTRKIDHLDQLNRHQLERMIEGLKYFMQIVEDVQKGRNNVFY